MVNRAPENFEHFLPQRNTLLIRGLILTASGILLTLLSVAVPEVRIMSQNSSWLPMVASVIVSTGFLASFDAFFWRHSSDFFINLQIAVLDSVVGVVLLAELNKSAENLILLAAAYLMIKGLFRIFAASTVNFTHAMSAISGGLLSFGLGLLLWQGWLSTSMWFICFCLSVDIMVRGWALVRFGVWLRGEYKKSHESHESHE